MSCGFMSLMRDSIVVLNILPQSLSGYKTEGASLRSWGNMDLLFGVKNPGAIFGNVLSPVRWWDERWQGRVFVLQPWDCSGDPCALLSHWSHSARLRLRNVYLSQCPGKQLGGFFRPSATDRIALFQFLLVFATLGFRLSSSHQCRCQRSCVIPVGKLPKFLQALGSCYYGSKSKLCLG